MTQYRNNYIKEAILRIDFTKSIDNFKDSLDEDLKTEILKHLNILETKDAFIDTLNIGPTEIVKKDRVIFKEWNFYGNEKSKRICITKDFYFISVTRYINDDDFIQPFKIVLQKINEKYPDFIAKRIGMRYINHIQINEPSPFSWDTYINNNLLSMFNIPERMNDITRAFHVLEINYDDENINLKYQYGMHNPDFPAKIRLKLFVLDFDAYKVGDLAVDEIEHIIPILHDRIEHHFENSITDDLRRKMNE